MSQVTEDSFTCPRCKGHRHKVISLPAWTLVHWIVNPAVFIGEVLLGIRQGAVTIVCEECNTEKLLRCYHQCPGCRRYHSVLLWAGFGHWFGLFCPDCGRRIPTVCNALSYALHIVLTPVRKLFWTALKQWWVNWEQARARRLREIGGDRRVLRHNSARSGMLGWGIPTWVVSMLWAFSTKGVSTEVALRQICALPVWLLGGVLFAYLMRYMLHRLPAR